LIPPEIGGDPRASVGFTCQIGKVRISLYYKKKKKKKENRERDGGGEKKNLLDN